MKLFQSNFVWQHTVKVFNTKVQQSFVAALIPTFTQQKGPFLSSIYFYCHNLKPTESSKSPHNTKKLTLS